MLQFGLWFGSDRSICWNGLQPSAQASRLKISGHLPGIGLTPCNTKMCCGCCEHKWLPRRQLDFPTSLWTYKSRLVMFAWSWHFDMLLWIGLSVRTNEKRQRFRIHIFQLNFPLVDHDWMYLNVSNSLWHDYNSLFVGSTRLDSISLTTSDPVVFWEIRMKS